MTIATAGTGGFGADSSATGPNAGYDPVMKFRKKVKDKKALTPENKLKESKENPSMPSRLFQYKVSIPEVGETIIYANSSAELMQKLRLLVNYRYRGDIKIERIMPGQAGKFFMDKRSKAIRNVKESVDKQLQQQMIFRFKKLYVFTHSPSKPSNPRTLLIHSHQALVALC